MARATAGTIALQHCHPHSPHDMNNSPLPPVVSKEGYGCLWFFGCGKTSLGVMFHTVPLLPISLILCSLGFVLALATLGSQMKYRPTHAEWLKAIEKAAAPHTPAKARACGTVELGANPEKSLKCVTAAMGEGHPFWVLSQGQGEDSIVWALFISEGADRYRSVEFDSYGWVDRGSPSFTWYAISCASPRIAQPGEPAVWCNRR